MLIALSGPSGIGKGFIKSAVLTRYPSLTELPWLTTRPLRIGEDREGNRIIIIPSRFDQLVSRERVVLVQELYGHRYAVLKKHLLDASRPRLTEIHPGNAHEVVRIRPDIHLVGFTTNDFELLRERLTKRGDANVDERMLVAQAEMAQLMDLQHLYHTVFPVSKKTEETLCSDVLRLIDTLFNPHKP